MSAVHAVFSAEQFRSEFIRVAAALKPLQKQARKSFAKTAPEFNLFTLLRLDRKEVLTHSPLLASLLNPAGTHAQGGLFLQCFLDHIKQTKGVFGAPAVSQDQHWLVNTEKVTELGNLDIIVWSASASSRIVIENKIGAADQKDQLPRYWKWMQARPCTFQHLFYLSPNGRPCKTAEEKNIPYVRLSYHEDIRDAIQKAIPQIGPARVRETLVQYLEIISSC